jgi:ornithine cyclodeaminase/alanine dehydrogenase-like protein (mu-crystallin family)
MPARIGKELVYLSRADVLGCEITPAAILEAVERAVRGSTEEITAAPPLNATVGRTRFAGKFGATGLEGQAIIKWYGLAGEPLIGRPGFWPLILMSDVRSGYPLAVIEGTWITSMRTAALTALAARALAHPDASTIGFVGCGVQARTHLTFLKTMFPLRRGAAIARTRASAEHFSVEAGAQGLAIAAVDLPRDAVDGCDIVVTTVPLHGGAAPFLDAAWFHPGASQ